MKKKVFKQKFRAVFISVQVIIFTRLLFQIDLMNERDNLCTIMQHSLICNYLKMTIITITTYICQSCSSFRLRKSYISLTCKQSNYMSVFIRRNIVFSVLFYSFVVTPSSILFII